MNMNRIIILFFCTFIIFTCQLKPTDSNNNQGTTIDYFPINIGDKWIYNDDDNTIIEVDNVGTIVDSAGNNVTVLQSIRKDQNEKAEDTKISVLGCH